MNLKSKKNRWLSLPRKKGGSAVTRRLLEAVAVGMIGDGLLSFIHPRRYVRLWDAGPKVVREVLQPLEEHPEATRWLGLVEAAAGFWLAFEQIEDE